MRLISGFFCEMFSECLQRERLTSASSLTAARERFWMNVKRHGGAAAAEAQR
jgi:hypothetical protein